MSRHAPLVVPTRRLSFRGNSRLGLACVAVLLLLAIGSRSAATTLAAPNSLTVVSLPATADAHVDSTHASTNFGSATALPVAWSHAPLRSRQALVAVNRAAAEVLRLCDGRRSLAGIASTLARRYQVALPRVAEDVRRLAGDLVDLGVLEVRAA